MNHIFKNEQQSIQTKFQKNSIGKASVLERKIEFFSIVCICSPRYPKSLMTMKTWITKMRKIFLTTAIPYWTKLSCISPMPKIWPLCSPKNSERNFVHSNIKLLCDLLLFTPVVFEIQNVRVVFGIVSNHELLLIYYTLR